jgi:hypothetical protein
VLKYKGRNLDPPPSPPTDVRDIVLNDLTEVTDIVLNDLTEVTDIVLNDLTDRDSQSDTYSSLNVINVDKT